MVAATGGTAEPAETEESEHSARKCNAREAASAKKKAVGAAQDGAKAPSQPWYKDQRKAMLAGGGAIALLAAVAGGSFILGGGSSNDAAPLEIPDLSGAEAIPIEGLGQLAAAERALAEEARTAGAPATAVNGLVAAGEQLDKQLAGLQPLADDPAQAGAATARVDEMKRTATTANVEFANALLRDAEARTQGLSANAPAASRRTVTTALSDLRTSVEASANSTDPVQSLGAARDALGKSQAFAAALSGAYGAQAASRRTTEQMPQAPRTATASTTTNTVTPSAPTATAATPSAATSSSSTGVSASKRSQLSSIVSSGRSLAKQVIQMGERRIRDPEGERAAGQEL